MTTQTATTKTLKAGIARKLLAGITGVKITGKGTDFEIECADEKAKYETQKALHATGYGRLGGYKTGYGAWVLRSGYRSAGDYNDRTSAWHY